MKDQVSSKANKFWHKPLRGDFIHFIFSLNLSILYCIYGMVGMDTQRIFWRIIVHFRDSLKNLYWQKCFYFGRFKTGAIDPGKREKNFCVFSWGRLKPPGHSPSPRQPALLGAHRMGKGGILPHSRARRISRRVRRFFPFVFSGYRRSWVHPCKPSGTRTSRKERRAWSESFLPFQWFEFWRHTFP